MVQLWPQFHVNRRTTIFKLRLTQQWWTSMVLTCDAYTQCRTQCCYAIVVCPTVTMRYCGSIGWVLRKQLNITFSHRTTEPKIGNLVAGEHLQISVGIWVGQLFSAENVQNLWNKARQDNGCCWLLIGSCICAFNLNDLEWPLCTLFELNASFEAQTKICSIPQYT